MKKLLLLSVLLISINGYSQHFTSNVKALVKVKVNRRDQTKLKPKEVIREYDELCLSDSLLIINSRSKIYIDLEVIEDNKEVKTFFGTNDDKLCNVVFVKTAEPKSIFVNYGEWGVVYFLNE